MSTAARRPAGGGAPPDGATRDTARAFLALWPGDDTRRRLTELQAGWEWPTHSALVPADRLHLTLHFLGQVPRDALAALSGRLDVPFTPFELRLAVAGVWASQGVAWLRPLAPPPPLQALHQRLAEVLRSMGLPVSQRRHDPHVTLARHARHAVPPANWDPIEWPVTGFVLVESVLRAPASYRILARRP